MYYLLKKIGFINLNLIFKILLSPKFIIVTSIVALFFVLVSLIPKSLKQNYTQSEKLLHRIAFRTYRYFIPFENLYLEINYSYTYAEDKSPARVTSKVLNILKHKVDAVLNYTIPQIGLKVTLVGLYMGKVWGQLPTASKPDLPAVKVDDYFVINAKVSKKFKDHFELYFGANNLFDEDYQSEIDFPAPGRNLYTGMKFGF